MSNKEVLNNFLIPENFPLAQALKKIVENKSGIVFLVDHHGRLTGCLSDGDFRGWALNNEVDIDSQVAIVANRNPFYLLQGDSADIEIPDGVEFIPVLNKSHHVINVIKRAGESLAIGGIKLGKGEKAAIIAEIGNNHNGSLELAFQLIDAAKKSGADIVKFQMRNLNQLNRDSIYGAEDVGVEYTNNLLRKFNLDPQSLYRCFDYAKQLGLEVMCTPFDVLSLRCLVDYGISGIKIASADLTNYPLLKEAARSHLTLIVSTGMSTSEEVAGCAHLLSKNLANFIPLHCNSTYPTPFKDVNLLYMPTLGALTSHGLFGYSGHERGGTIPIAAIALGAKVIEKHFTLNKSLEGNDHRVSLLPDEFKTMVRAIREVEEALGSASMKLITQGELINRESLAKSIVASRDLLEGEVISEEMLEYRSPGRGIQPDKKDLIIGKSINRPVKRHDFIFLSDFQSSNVLKKEFNISRYFGVPVRFHDVNSIIKGSNLNLLEFHLTYNDLFVDIGDLKIEAPIKKFVVHAPELFGDDHILDLASKDADYLEKSISYLRDVVSVTEKLKRVVGCLEKIQIVVNVGGFSEDDFIGEESKEILYKAIADNLTKVETENVEFIVQTMPPYPWHFGGQRHHNLFVRLTEIESFCKKYGRRVCLDISHSAMAATYDGSSLLDFVKNLGEYTAHLHISDAVGLDGEGLQIDEGEIEFKELVLYLNQYCPNASVIPEIWQGHKDFGVAFFIALERLESHGL